MQQEPSGFIATKRSSALCNGQCSSWEPIKARVPQGSMLGLLLFLVYINDITFPTESSEMRLLADDTILYLFVDNPVQNAEAVKYDLEKISN